MSDFFQPPPPPAEPEPERAQPPWIGPPENELGVAVGLRLLLARTERVALALTDVVAYSTGLTFSVHVRLRTADELVDPYGYHLRHRRGGRGSELPPELLRFGVELADGRRATNVGGFPGFHDASERPVLIERGGGGGGRSWSHGYWLWPLPPPPSLAIVVEWPQESIALTRHDVDAEPLRRAAADSEPLWPDGGAAAGGASVITQELFRGGGEAT